MKRAIGYLRQSTTKQQSLPAQKQAIELLAPKHNIQHIQYISDKQSGRTDKRNGYLQITKLIQQEQYDVLCCYRLNRLHRNLKNALDLMKLCQKHHVHILSVCDGYFDMDKAFDRLKLNIFMSMAELESDNISEQVNNGIKEKARQGKLITTHSPFGYHYKHGTFTINKNESLTVIAIFNYYLQGNGYKKISQFLEEDNKLLNRKPYQVRNIIMNPNYCGRVNNKYGTFDNMFPPIISKAMYKKAQAIRVNKQVQRTPSANLLKQKIKCPCCGSTLTNMTIRKKQHTLRYYVCPRNMNESRFVCNFKGINASELETNVLTTCQNFFQNQQLYLKINDVIQQRIKKQRSLETKNALTQEQLIDKLAKGTIDAQTFKEQSQTLCQQSENISSIKDDEFQSSFQNVIQQRFTLNMLYPYIDEIHITNNKEIVGIYFKNEPLNIVNQQSRSSIA
ncbi:cassette chromosome recombinase CcrA [Mammaliicoccus sciuri]|uniref:cassette chromosome recombinase CcrA n=1 Tax=Mammaliicoccus sciuri TaxID=1296 RepID=UPI002DBC0D62|nr:recombinase family protein [Mammaliicoccus sciuri]MEB7397235.1 recombinase family protein [Mammaliicoccus sciuri]